jgi:two-component system, chemotaxis family, chemotaxis protein CheY
MNILIVDDSKVVRKLIISILNKNKFDCIEAEDGIEALEKLVINDVDLIIADLNMPKMSGLELVRTIRGSDIYNNIPILMLTTEKNEQDKQECLKAGVNIYLAKPLPHQELIDTIKLLLKENHEAKLKKAGG